MAHASDRVNTAEREAETAHVPLNDTAVAEVPPLGRVATTDGLFVVDERQRIVSWSSSAQRLLGYTPEEVVGRPCYMVLLGREADGHPVCRRGCQVVVNARRGRGTAVYETAARARDGEVRYLSNSVLVLGGEASKTFRVLHLFREVGRAARPVTRTETPVRAATATERLTRRELEALRVFAEGSTTEEVGAALGVSRFTARNHIASIQRKLGARNRLEIMVIALRAGLL